MTAKYVFDFMKSQVVKNIVFSAVVSFLLSLYLAVRNGAELYERWGSVAVVSIVIFFFLLLVIFFLVYTAFSALFGYLAVSKQRELLVLYEQKGICNEYADLYAGKMLLTAQASAQTKLMGASYFVALDRLDEAESLFRTIDPNRLPSKLRAMFYNDISVLYLKRKNVEAAIATLQNNYSFLTRTAGKNRQLKLAVADTLASAYAMNGEYEKAFSFLQEIRPENRDETEFMFILNSYVFIYSLMKNREQLEIAVDNAISYLGGIKSFKYKWQYDFYRKKTEQALQGIY